MADIVPINTDVPASYEPPGVYFQIRAQGGGSILSSAFKRVIIWGHKGSSGTMAFNVPVRCSSASEAFTLAQQGSDLARQYQAYAARAGNGVADVYLIAVPVPTAGTAATRKIIFAGSITAAGGFDVWVCGYLHSLRASTSDTPTSLGDALAAVLNANTNLPMTFANVSGAVTGTYRHVGYVGNDVPMIVNQNGATGITVSCGTVTYTTDPTGSAGSATVTIGGTTITAAIDPAVETTISLVAAKVAAAINAGAYPVTATAAMGVMTLLFAPDRVVNKISAAIVTFTATTVAVACGTVAANSSGERPVLTTALANLANFAGGARLWLSPWFNVGTIGTMATHIEIMQNGLNQRDQYLFVGSNDGIVTAGGIPSGTSPALTGKYRYTVVTCPDSPQQGYEEAAACVGLVARESYIPKNYDGAEILSDAAGAIPNLLPHQAVRIGPQSDDAQAAMHTYGLTVIAVTADGVKVVVKGRTTDLTPATSGGVPDWGVAQHLGLMRVEFVNAGSAAVKGKSIRRNGTPRSENTITLMQIKSALVAKGRDLDGQDLYDGIDVWKDAFVLRFNDADPSRVDGFVPLAAIRSLHTLGLVGSPV